MPMEIEQPPEPMASLPEDVFNPELAEPDIQPVALDEPEGEQLMEDVH